ncbi:MAG: response regulator [Planctomycetota bacterium]
MTAGRVLIVEDEPIIGELLCEVLYLYEYESRCVLSGAAGIVEARNWNPDAIILDLMLPDVDGYEVCRTLKNDTRTQNIAILILTGMLAHSDRVRGFRVGCDRFLTKPFQPDEVVRELHSMISDRQQTRLTGIRRSIIFEFITPVDFARQIRLYQGDLFRATPLSTDTIERFGKCLSAFGERFFAWRSKSDGAFRLQLVCRIYRDRLEHSLHVDPRNEETRVILRELLGQGKERVGLPIADVLSSESSAVPTLTDSGPFVLSYQFAGFEP